jgi:acyl-coenzyme A synthetase/AMP-(fatty) acid ligase
MIIRGRYNIYPALYEPKIAELPGVARCALIGLWDERIADERVILVLEPSAEAKDLNRLKRDVDRALREGDLIDVIALPDEIAVMPLPESGRSNKIDRNALRKLLSTNRRSPPSS